MNLSPEARAAKNEYQKKWAAKNRQKTQKYIEQYWERLAHKQVTDNVTDKLTVTKLTVTCQVCGGKFNPKRSDAKFCSTPCRVRFKRKHTENWSNKR